MEFTDTEKDLMQILQDKEKEINKIYYLFKIILDNTQGEKKKLRDFLKQMQDFIENVSYTIQGNFMFNTYNEFDEKKYYKSFAFYFKKNGYSFSFALTYKDDDKEYLSLKIRIYKDSESTLTELFCCELEKTSEELNFKKEKSLKFKELNKMLKDLKEQNVRN